jgi:molybdenum cofactor cytidylyltransferase
MRRIIRERSEKSLVLATTTTNLAKHEADIAPVHYVIHSSEDLDQALTDLPQEISALFTGPLNPTEEKWTSLPDDFVLRLVERVKVSGGILLIEADGARGKLLKVPAEHEPMIPPMATTVVPVLRIDVLDHPLTDDVVHRSERVAKLLGIEEGSPLCANDLAQLLSDEAGGMKNVPELAKVRVFINGVDTYDLLNEAQVVAGELESDSRISSVVLGSLNNDIPVVEVWGKTGIVVLAAGGSSRFGTPKLLESWRGEGILRHVVEMVLASGYGPAVVVLGAEFDQLSESISDQPIPFIENPQWSDGQSTSVITGLRAIEDRCEAVIFVLGDMPAVDQSNLNALVDAHRVTLESIIAPYARERWGNPVLFDCRTFSDLKNLEGDRGGRVLFDKYPPHSISSGTDVLFDIDSPDDLDIKP